MTLRDYQEEARDTAERLLPNLARRSMVIQACTGAGKTEIANSLRPDVVVAPGIDLVRQLRGRIQGASVHTIQSLSASLDRGEELPKAKRVVLDEGRCAAAPKWCRVPEWYTEHGAELVILDATPATSTGHGLGKWADYIHQVSSMEELVSQGHIVPYRVVPSDGINEKPVDVWLQKANGRRALAFCRDKRHASRSVAEFIAAGIPAAVIADDTPEAMRCELLGYTDESGAWVQGSLARGDIWVLVCAHILRQGIDIPEVEAILLDRACSSYFLFQQAIGRGSRPCLAIGKKDCLVVDMRGDMTDKHGLPTDHKIWSLGEKAMRDAFDLAEPSVCSVASCATYGRGDTCRTCGAKLPLPFSMEAKRANCYKFVRQLLRGGGHAWDAKNRYKALYDAHPPVSWVWEAINDFRARKLRPIEHIAPIAPPMATYRKRDIDA